MDSLHFIGLDNEDGTQRQVQVTQRQEPGSNGGTHLLDTFDLSINDEPAGMISFNEDYSAWEYKGDLTQEDQKIVAEALQRRYNNEQYGEYEDSEGFTFLWAKDEETTVVEVVPNEGHFGIKINGEYIGDIEQDEDTEAWNMLNYELDTALVQEIGRKIEEHYM